MWYPDRVTFVPSQHSNQADFPPIIIYCVHCTVLKYEGDWLRQHPAFTVDARPRREGGSTCWMMREVAYSSAYPHPAPLTLSSRTQSGQQRSTSRVKPCVTFRSGT